MIQRAPDDQALGCEMIAARHFATFGHVAEYASVGRDTARRVVQHQLRVGVRTAHCDVGGAATAGEAPLCDELEVRLEDESNVFERAWRSDYVADAQLEPRIIIFLPDRGRC